MECGPIGQYAVRMVLCWRIQRRRNDRQKVDCAVDFIKTLVDIGIPTKVIKSAGEYDEKLEEAIESVFDDEEDDGYDE